jgi:hypothetical protein
VQRAVRTGTATGRWRWAETAGGCSGGAAAEGRAGGRHSIVTAVAQLTLSQIAGAALQISVGVEVLLYGAALQQSLSRHGSRAAWRLGKLVQHWFAAPAQLCAGQPLTALSAHSAAAAAPPPASSPPGTLLPSCILPTPLFSSSLLTFWKPHQQAFPLPLFVLAAAGGWAQGEGVRAGAPQLLRLGQLWVWHQRAH